MSLKRLRVFNLQNQESDVVLPELNLDSKSLDCCGDQAFVTASTSINDFRLPFRTTCVEDPLPKILLHSEWIMENDQLFWRQTYLCGRVKKLLVCGGFVSFME